MTAQSYERRRRSVQEIANELRHDGWIVHVEPRSVDLPEPIRNFKVDLIATRDDEILIAEIVSRRSAKVENIDLLAKQVRLVPNARFEVFWRGDAPEAAPPLENVSAYIKEARAVTNVTLNGALLISWAALEGALLRLGESLTDLINDWRSPRQLLDSMYSLGFINDSDFKRLSALWRLRNDIAHGASRGSGPKKEDIDFILDIAERMARGKYVSVDQMVEWFLVHYEDLARHTPHDSKDGYAFLDNGPYDAETVLVNNFPDVSADAISEAVRVLEETSIQWVSKDDR